MAEIAKCQGVRGVITDCPNIAEFEVIGLVAVYGTPAPQKLCRECLAVARKRYPCGFPMMSDYNEYPLLWRQLGNTGNFIGMDGGYYTEWGERVMVGKKARMVRKRP